MAANPSKITASASSQNNSDNDSDNDSKQLLVLIKEQEEAFEQFQRNMLVATTVPTSEQCKKIEPFFSIFPIELTKLMMRYLKGIEIPPLEVIPPILSAYNSESYKIMRLRRLASELLSHVFGAKSEPIDAFLRTPGIHPKILLTETRYVEGYDSKKLGSFVPFRKYKKISPLVAAYRCGDGPFLGRRILAHLLRDNNLPLNEKERLLCEARRQLTELLKRIRPEISTETANTKTCAETNMMTASGGVASTATAASATTAVSPNDTASNKATTELNSGSSTNANEFSDDDEFLSAIVKLINAYKAYTSQYDALAAKNKMVEIDALWGEVCECQKRVYHYVKLEFFGPIPFSPLSPELFIAEPPRGPCRYHDNQLLDLDKIGRDTQRGLFRSECSAGQSPAPSFPFDTFQRIVGLDLEAISHLYKLRVADIRNTIDQLHSLEAALTFINDIKPLPRIDL